MTQMPVAERVTAEEFLAMPVSSAGWTAELIDGEVVVNDPGARHGHVQENLIFAMADWFRAAPGRGRAVVPRDIDMDEHNIFKPDLSWYAAGRLPDPASRPPYALPDLCAEIRSPSTWRYDIGAKRAAYERRGLPELWLLDTVASTVLVCRRSAPSRDRFDVALELDESDQLTSPQLPGFALAVSELFAMPSA